MCPSQKDFMRVLLLLLLLLLSLIVVDRANSTIITPTFYARKRHWEIQETFFFFFNNRQFKAPYELTVYYSSLIRGKPKHTGIITRQVQSGILRKQSCGNGSELTQTPGLTFISSYLLNTSAASCNFKIFVFQILIA